MFDDSLPPYYRLITVWWLPSLKIKKFRVPFLANRKFIKLSFHVLDRYEIHIQALVGFINWKLIIFQSSSPQNYFEKYVIVFTKKRTKPGRKSNDMVPRTYKLPKKYFFEIHIDKIIYFQDGSIIFLYCLKHFGNS